MKRPGPVGVTMILTFTLVAVIELRTVLAMVGFDVPLRPYFGVSMIGVATLLGLVYLLTEGNRGNPTSA